MRSLSIEAVLFCSDIKYSVHMITDFISLNTENIVSNEIFHCSICTDFQSLGERRKMLPFQFFLYFIFSDFSVHMHVCLNSLSILMFIIRIRSILIKKEVFL